MSTTPTPTSYVTVKELANILRTTKSAIYQRVYRKELPVKRLKRRVYFAMDEIEALLNVCVRQ